MTLRAYQSAALDRVERAELAGARVVALVGPTGMGKTRCGAEWASRQAVGSSGCWAAHRKELLDQARAAMAPIVWNVNYVSVQSGPLPPADWYVLDECHHYYGSPEWSQNVAVARTGPTLALTATPGRADGTGLGNLADAIVVAAQPKELIRDGWLVRSEVIAAKAPTRTLTEHPLAAWQKHARGRKTIVFCRDVKHAQATAEEFRVAGVPAACIDGGITVDVRAARLAAHARGDLIVLTTVQVLTEGYDDPTVSCAIMARGFSSALAWVQACGRVVRPFPGKTSALIIDLRGSVYMWGLPDEDRSYSLEGKAMRLGPDDDGEAIRQCRSCSRVFRASAFKDAICPVCGMVCRGKPDPKVRREKIARVLSAHTQEDRRRKFAELRAIAKAKGYSHKWSVVQYKLRYGAWPGRDVM